ncbi:hypothetical protein SAMN06265346_101110 [Flavobacterium hercynium]|nr:hypothetical protein SAMN06265346_101110 [Flavobacterium hercynium]
MIFVRITFALLKTDFVLEKGNNCFFLKVGFKNN